VSLFELVSGPVTIPVTPSKGVVGLALGLGEMVGDELVGEEVGEDVGEYVGKYVGEVVGEVVGDNVGAEVSLVLGELVDETVGIEDTVGSRVGITLIVGGDVTITSSKQKSHAAEHEFLTLLPSFDFSHFSV